MSIRTLALGCMAIIAAASAQAAVIPVASYSLGTNPRFYLDSGGELTDGVWAPQIQPSEMWVGWDQSFASITFDLGSSQAVGGIDIVFCKWGNAAVYAPDFVSFEFSDTPNFSSSTLVTFNSTLDLSHGGFAEVRSHVLNSSPTGRYVRLVADHDRQWIFIGEVTFSTPIPAPGAAGLMACAALVGLRRRRA